MEIIPTALEILDSMEEIYLSNFRRLSIVTPKYLPLLLMRIDELFNERSIVGGGLLSLKEIITALDLQGFTISMFKLNHFEILSRSLFMVELNWDGVGAEKTGHVSSANNLGTQLTECGKSLIKIKNKRGPRVEP